MKSLLAVVNRLLLLLIASVLLLVGARVRGAGLVRYRRQISSPRHEAFAGALNSRRPPTATPRGKETRSSKFVLRKQRNEVPQVHDGRWLELRCSVSDPFQVTSIQVELLS